MLPVKSTIKTGLNDVCRHGWITAVIYAANLVTAFVVSIPFYTALQTRVGMTGFGRDMSRGFDLVLWADILADRLEVFGPVFLQLLWAVPLILLWNAAVGVGLILALHTTNGRNFWRGIVRFTIPAVGLAVLFLIALFGWSVLATIVATGLNVSSPGEVGTFWAWVVLFPFLLAAGIFALDLMQDYGRMFLVIGRSPIGRAWVRGIKWPFQHPVSILIYLVWFAAAAVTIVLPFVLDGSVAAASTGSIWMLFLFQQLLLVVRAAVTVGWIGSEVTFYKDAGGPEYQEPELEDTGEDSPLPVVEIRSPEEGKVE